MLSVYPLPLRIMHEDAAITYPEECCGFFFGRENADGDRQILDAMVVDNAKEGDKKRRFIISAADYLRAEQYAADKGLELLGVYHSHPEHPAIPSEHDRVAAQPFFSYVIISVKSAEVVDTRSWRLNDDLQFEEEKIHLPVNIIQ